MKKNIDKPYPSVYCTIMKITLKDIIKARELTIDEAAKELGITRQHLSGILSGKIPGRKTAIRIQEWTLSMIKAKDLLRLP